MIKTPPSPTPVFVRICDRDLTEIELHSVESINDLHRTHTDQVNKGSRRAHPRCPSTNGVLQRQGMPVFCQTGFPKRRWGRSRICGFSTATVFRYSGGCLAVTLMLVTIGLIFYFLVQQGGALRALSQGMRDRQYAALEISQLIQELQELRRNLTASRGSQPY